MSISSIKSALPDYAKDLRLNLDSVLTEGGAPGLTLQQIHAIAVASAVAGRHSQLTAAIDQLAASTLSAAERDGARTAAALMAMTNVYYRATHLIENTEYATMRTGLRMNAMGNPGIDKVSFELAAIAVSAINGCGACLDSHEKVIREHGISAQGVQSALRIAAVIHAVAVTLEQSVAINAELAQAA